MSFGLAYWILMLIWLVWGFYQPGPWTARGGNLMLFILLLLLGWAVFQAPLHR